MIYSLPFPDYLRSWMLLSGAVGSVEAHSHQEMLCGCSRGVERSSGASFAPSDVVLHKPRPPPSPRESIAAAVVGPKGECGPVREDHARRTKSRSNRA